jgi:hypothetical protein
MTCQVSTLSAMTDVSHSKRQPDLLDDAVNGAFVSEAKTRSGRILWKQHCVWKLNRTNMSSWSATGAEIIERARSHRIAGPPEFRSCDTALTLFSPYVSCS